tara:strand:- start:317 stop:484 length:168 start_codon:yes stop_codon:yes gene_type:complete
MYNFYTLMAYTIVDTSNLPLSAGGEVPPFKVLDSSDEWVYSTCTEEEAQEWIDNQ